MQAHGAHSDEDGRGHEGSAHVGQLVDQRHDTESHHQAEHPHELRAPGAREEGLSAHLTEKEGGHEEAHEERDEIGEKEDEPEGNAENGEHDQDGDHGHGHTQEGA